MDCVHVCVGPGAVLTVVCVSVCRAWCCVDSGVSVLGPGAVLTVVCVSVCRAWCCVDSGVCVCV